jgi:Holliday junction resolvase RusA-like endonuclease
MNHNPTEREKQIIDLNFLPCVLNQLYTPIIKGKLPAIIKSKKGRDQKRLIQMTCISQKVKKLSGDLKISIDFEIAGRDKDIDSIMKNLLDSLEGFAYDNDKQIKELHIRKHKSKEDRVIILLETINE